jgi:hypothetical protein
MHISHTLVMMPSKRRYTFWINEAEAEGLKRVKDADGIAESEQIRQAIRDWLRRKGITQAPRRRVSPRRRS